MGTSSVMGRNNVVMGVNNLDSNSFVMVCEGCQIMLVNVMIIKTHLQGRPIGCI
jgi:hypothetical protein